MVCGRGSGRSQLKSVSGADRARLCGHVKLLLLNSADYQEYPDRKVGARACATSSALSSSILPFKRFGLNLLKKKKMIDQNLDCSLQFAQVTLPRELPWHWKFILSGVNVRFLLCVVGFAGGGTPGHLIMGGGVFRKKVAGLDPPMY